MAEFDPTLVDLIPESMLAANPLLAEQVANNPARLFELRPKHPDNPAWDEIIKDIPGPATLSVIEKHRKLGELTPQQARERILRRVDALSVDKATADLLKDKFGLSQQEARKLVVGNKVQVGQNFRKRLNARLAAQQSFVTNPLAETDNPIARSVAKPVGRVVAMFPPLLLQRGLQALQEAFQTGQNPQEAFNQYISDVQNSTAAGLNAASTAMTLPVIEGMTGAPIEESETILGGLVTGIAPNVFDPTKLEDAGLGAQIMTRMLGASGTLTRALAAEGMVGAAFGGPGAAGLGQQLAAKGVSKGERALRFGVGTGIEAAIEEGALFGAGQLAAPSGELTGRTPQEFASQFGTRITSAGIGGFAGGQLASRLQDYFKKYALKSQQATQSFIEFQQNGRTTINLEDGTRVRFELARDGDQFRIFETRLDRENRPIATKVEVDGELQRLEHKTSEPIKSLEDAVAAVDLRTRKFLVDELPKIELESPSRVPDLSKDPKGKGKIPLKKMDKIPRTLEPVRFDEDLATFASPQEPFSLRKAETFRDYHRYSTEDLLNNERAIKELISIGEDPASKGFPKILQDYKIWLVNRQLESTTAAIREGRLKQIHPDALDTHAPFLPVDAQLVAVHKVDQPAAQAALEAFVRRETKEAARRPRLPKVPKAVGVAKEQLGVKNKFIAAKLNKIADSLENGLKTAMRAETPFSTPLRWIFNEKLLAHQGVLSKARETDGSVAKTVGMFERRFLKALTKEDEKILDEVFKGERKITELSKPLRQVAAGMILQIRKNGRDFVRLGAMSSEEYAKRAGKFVHREYLARRLGRKVKGAQGLLEPAIEEMQKKFPNMKRSDIEGFLESMLDPTKDSDQAFAGLVVPQKDLNVDDVTPGLLRQRVLDDLPTVREYVREIDDGVFNAINTLAQTTSVVEEMKFYRWLDNNLATISQDAPDQMVRLSGFKNKGWQEILERDNKILGPLADKEMPRWMAEMIQGRMAIRHQLVDNMGGWMGVLKGSKFLVNAGSYVRQVFGNSFYSVYADNSIFKYRMDPDITESYDKVVDSMVGWIKTGEVDPLLAELLENRVIGVGSFGTESRGVLKRMLERKEFKDAWADFRGDDPRKARQAFKFIIQLGRNAMAETKGGVEFLGTYFDFADSWMRGAAYYKATRAGVRTSSFGTTELMDPRQATQHVNNWFPNYEELPNGIQNIRKNAGFNLIGNAFFPFIYENTRIHLRALTRKPGAAMSVAGAFMLLSKLGEFNSGLSEEEIKEIKDNMPLSYTYPNRLMIFSPLYFGDEPHLWDLTYTYPGADMLHGVNIDPSQSPVDDVLWNVGQFAANTFANGLASRTLATLRQDSDFGGAQEQAATASELTLSAGGDFLKPGGVYNYGQLLSIARHGNRRDFFGEETDLQESALKIVGAATRSADPKILKKRRRLEFSRIFKQLEKSALSKKAKLRLVKDPAEREKIEREIKELQERAKKLKKAFRKK